MGSGLASSVQAIENQLLLQYNQEYQLSQGDSLPLPRALSGYTYLGYIKKDKDSSQQETAARDQKLDYTVQPHFQTNEGGQRAGDEQKARLLQSLLKIHPIKIRLVLRVWILRMRSLGWSREQTRTPIQRPSDCNQTRLFRSGAGKSRTNRRNHPCQTRRSCWKED